MPLPSARTDINDGHIRPLSVGELLRFGDATGIATNGKVILRG